MNGVTHLILGGAAGALTKGINKVSHGKKEADDSKKLLAATVGGIFGGIIPDILEPAVSPKHRKTFHSIFVGSLLIGLIYGLFRNREDGVYKSACVGLLYGYLSHLAGDATTRAGLPLI